MGINILTVGTGIKALNLDSIKSDIKALLTKLFDEASNFSSAKWG